MLALTSRSLSQPPERCYNRHSYHPCFLTSDSLARVSRSAFGDPVKRTELCSLPGSYQNSSPPNVSLPRPLEFTLFFLSALLRAAAMFQRQVAISDELSQDSQTECKEERERSLYVWFSRRHAKCDAFMTSPSPRTVIPFYRQEVQRGCGICQGHTISSGREPRAACHLSCAPDRLVSLASEFGVEHWCIALEQSGSSAWNAG